MPMKIWFILTLSDIRLYFFFSLSNHLISRVIWPLNLLHI
jgi:hypothetical protein